MRILLERLYPYLFGIAAAYAARGRSLSLPAGNDILTASITIGSIFTGFLATSQSIIITFDSPLVVRLRKTPYFKLLLTYLSEAIWCSLLFCAFSLIGYFITPAPYPSTYSMGWFFLSTATFVSFFRITSILAKIFEKGSG